MQENRRGVKVALGGLVLQAVLAGLTLTVWWFTQAPAAWAAAWFVVAPIPTWLLSVILFHCRYLQRREARELEELAARGGPEGIFAAEGPEGGPIRPAAARLRWMERYLVAAFTLLLAGYHVALGALLLRAAPWERETFVRPGVAAWMFAAVGLAFAAFLFSRYATGMAKVRVWQPLRAPGAYLFTDSLVLLLVAGVLAAEHYRSMTLGHVVAWVLPVFMIVVGGELLLNFILDLYRPRVPGGEHRFSYDSRLLNLIASPESIGHSIAEALNYQFGFEVSSTWFYQLLQRALVPLLLAAGAILWAMTAVVVVEEGEAYVVFHWGRPYPSDNARRLLTPRRAPYLIWPWPIDSARRFQTGKVQEIVLGVGAPRKTELVRGKRLYLWTQEHGEFVELDTLVAMPPPPEDQPGREDGQAQRIPSVSLIKFVVGVYYRVADPYKYGYTVTDARQLLEAVSYREMVRYAASATLDAPLPEAEPTPMQAGLCPVLTAGAAAGAIEGFAPRACSAGRVLDGLLWGAFLIGQPEMRPQGILSFGRDRAARDLHERIARALGRWGIDLGVEIVRVEILASHPPAEAAPAFEKVIAAERQQDQERYKAQADANQLLTAAAGDRDLALRLWQAMSFRQELEDLEGVRGRGEDVVKALADTKAGAAKEQADLQGETDQERLLGKGGPGRRTAAQWLLQEQRTFVGALEGLDPRSGDFAAVLAGQLAQAVRTVESLFDQAEGQAAVTVAQARAERWQTEFRQRARAEGFQAELLGLRAAPHFYRYDKYLEVLSEGMKDRRKFILGLDRDRIEVWMNAEQPETSVGELPLGGKK